VAALAGRTPRARARADRWTRAKGEWAAAAGWDVVAALALRDPDLPDGYFAGRLEEIEAGIGAAKNRVRYSMNGALIAIGQRSEALKSQALAAAARIGPVEVDHGDTSCQTPDAAAYIAKAWQRKAAKKGKAAKRA
jgi:hypothetical protein